MIENYLKFFSDFLSSLPNIFFSLSDIDKVISIGLLSSIFVILFLLMRTSKKKKFRYTRDTDTSFVREKEELRPNDLKDSEEVSEPEILDIPEKGVSEKGTRARESSEFVRDTDTSFIRGKRIEEKSHVEKAKILKSKLESKKDDSLQEEPFHPDDLKDSEGVPEPKILAVPESWRISEKPKEESEKEIDRMPFSGICDFCGRKIGGPIKSKRVKIKPYDPERIESVRSYRTETLDLPFICSRCGKTFCQEHRLPEQHNCPNL